MSHQTFSIDEVAEYLHLALPDVERLVKAGEMPVENRGGRQVFRKHEIDAWASQRILGLEDKRLTDYHNKTSQGTRQIFETELILPQMVKPEYIDAAMPARTKASVLREMVALAGRTGLVMDARDLLESLEGREELCSTAVGGGLALMHPRHHEPYMFDSSFIVLGRPVQEIHFGAPDGQPTRIFFLVCCQDDRIHLHTLARLCLMAQKTSLLDWLQEVPDAQSMYECLLESERQVIEGRKAPVTS